LKTDSFIDILFALCVLFLYNELELNIVYGALYKLKREDR